DLGGFADHDAHSVVDEHATADPGPRVYLDPRQEAAPVREPAREPAQAVTPRRMHDETMPDKRVQSRVAGQDFPGGARRGIAIEHYPDVFAQSAEPPTIMAFPSVLLNYGQAGAHRRLRCAGPRRCERGCLAGC